MHPVRTAKRAVTPKAVRKVSRAVYTVTNPLGAAENKLIGAALGSGHKRRRSTTQRRTRSARTSHPASARSPAGTPMTSTDVRASEAMASTAQLANLMTVQRERFTPAQHPIVPAPSPVDPAPFARQEWQRHKGEAHIWQRSRRKQLRSQAAEHGSWQAASQFDQAQAQQYAAQAQADAWWQSLIRGDSEVLTAVLVAAFADNPAPVVVHQAAGTVAILTVLLPGFDVLPEKKAYVTPTGRLSSKAWTKTELHEVYAGLLGAHLLATIRESWAVAPSLITLRIRGEHTIPYAPAELLFDVTVTRQVGRWDDDSWGSVVLQNAKGGLRRVGKAREVRAWQDVT
jgi:hypothetical protein